MNDDPFGIREAYQREAAERAALPYFVTYEPNPCPLCGRIRWQRMSDGAHTCEKCGWHEEPSDAI